jgi:2-(1,2-epoxy-1,2-dihydrophenyl)acetyl-CoA isomerase
MQEFVDVQREGKTAIITLNAPAKRNALIADIRNRVIAALDELEMDAGCRAIVLTGAGGYFCAGGDIGIVKPLTPLEVRSRVKVQQALIEKIVRHSKPIFAAVEGPAFGAGFALATACDFVIASEAATFCAAYGKIGVMPDLGLLWSLAGRANIGTLREIVMFCDVIRAPEAKVMGIVDQLAPEGGALELALVRAARLANAATASISLTKTLLARSPLNLQTVFDAEADGQATLSSSEDSREGIKAFAERRAPEFKGC